MLVKLNDEGIVTEEVWIAGSMIKWIFFALITGVVVGSGTALFINTLKRSIDFVSQFGKVRYLLIFPGLWLSYFLVYKLTKNEKVDVEGAINHHDGEVNPKAIIVRLISSIITIASGGSVGKEGPGAQIGAGLMYTISKIFNLNEYDRKRLVTCGMSAGISAVFGTPITGAIFGVEILYSGRIDYNVLLPSFIGGIVSGMTANYWNAVHVPFFIMNLKPIEANMVFMSIASGVFFGLVAMMHIQCLSYAREQFSQLNVPHWVKPLIGASGMFILALIWGPLYLGLGDSTITTALKGGDIPLTAFAIKSIAMAITLACGGNGGVLTPTLFIGAVAGSAFATVLGLPKEIFSALGLVAVLSGSTNSPLASTTLAMELFGSTISPYAGIACCVAYVVTGHRSLYSGQIIDAPKTRAFVRKITSDGEEKIVCRYEGIPLEKVAKHKIKMVKKNLPEISIVPGKKCEPIKSDHSKTDSK